jgi:integrative and conjugative element protein (TIGR02256 family)
MSPRLIERPVLTVPRSIARAILAETLEHAPRETGGVMLGHRDGRAREIFVSELIAAGPGAVRESHRFEPDGPWQRARIAERYEASGRMLDYLGDWHSHPKGSGPSSLDRATARRIARAPRACCPHPVFLIATCVGEGWELHAYRLARRRLGPISVLDDPQ